VRPGLRAELAEINPDMVILEGLDDAVIGVVERCGTDAVLLYSVEAILQVLQDRDGMDPDDAREFFDFNIGGLYAGEGTPFFLEETWWQHIEEQSLDGCGEIETASHGEIENQTGGLTDGLSGDETPN